MLRDLMSATKYRVLVSAVYRAGESMAVSATYRTAACPALHPDSSLSVTSTQQPCHQNTPLSSLCVYSLRHPGKPLHCGR